MTTSQDGLSLIEKHEGLELRAYQDQVGKWTIGIGATYFQGRPVVKGDTLPNIQAAYDLLARQVVTYERAVNQYVTAKISQNAFDALVDFTYNLGVGALEHSHMLVLINQNPHDPAIGHEIVKWDHAGGKVLHDLLMRRMDEYELYLT